MKASVKQNILETGARIIHHKGYNHTGIQEILKAAGVPKGSFYFYFKNKEDFGLQVIDYFNGFYAEKAEAILKDRNHAPLKRIETFFDGFAQLFMDMDYTCGCPIGNFAQEMGDISPEFRDKLKGAYKMMTGFYVDALTEAKENGDISKDLDVENAAEFIVYSWQGALMKMKVDKGPETLEKFKRFIFQTVLRS